MSLTKELDHEASKTVDLVIKASKHCKSTFWTQPENQNNPWNETDHSLMFVEVLVNDINDSPPIFTKRWFTAGVTRDTQVGEPVLELAVRI